MRHGNFTVWIEVEGDHAPEFCVESTINDAGVPVQTCWIPSTTGKSFSVHWTDSSRVLEDTVCDFYVDGHFVSGKILYANRASTSGLMWGIRVSSTEKRPYVFSNVELTDDDSYLMSAASTSTHTGELELKIFPVLLSHGTLPFVPFVPPVVSKVHERSKKGLAHQTGFGEKIQTKPLTSVSRTTLLPQTTSFIFKYRPLDLLVANGIAPRPASAPNLGVKRGADFDDVIEISEEEGDDNDPDIVRLKAELAAAISKKKDNRSTKRVKVEQDIKPIIPGVVVDLT